MGKRIPIAEARRVADAHNLRQVLLIGFDGELVHIVTYGKTKADCVLAAKAQDFWAGHIREFSFKGERADTAFLAGVKAGLDAALAVVPKAERPRLLRATPDVAPTAIYDAGVAAMGACIVGAISAIDPATITPVTEI